MHNIRLSALEVKFLGTTFHSKIYFIIRAILNNTAKLVGDNVERKPSQSHMPDSAFISLMPFGSVSPFGRVFW